MNRDTIFVYTAGTNSVTFAYKSPLWITSITGASGNDVAVSESQGAGQVGSTISNQSVQPRDITINGAVLAAVEANRRGILACVLPGVTGRLTVIQNGESWYIDARRNGRRNFPTALLCRTFNLSCIAPTHTGAVRRTAARRSRALRSCSSFRVRWQAPGIYPNIRTACSPS